MKRTAVGVLAIAAVILIAVGCGTPSAGGVMTGVRNETDVSLVARVLGADGVKADYLIGNGEALRLPAGSSPLVRIVLSSGAPCDVLAVMDYGAANDRGEGLVVARKEGLVTFVAAPTASLRLARSEGRCRDIPTPDPA